MDEPWREPPFTDFYDYWYSLFVRCGGLPQRSLFNPMKLPADIPECQILERDGREVTSRLAGSVVEAQTRMTMKPGMSLRDMYSPDDYQMIVDSLIKASDTGCCILARNERTIDSIYTIQFLLLILPFAQSDSGVFQYVLRGTPGDESRVVHRTPEHPVQLLDFQMFTPGEAVTTTDVIKDVSA